MKNAFYTQLIWVLALSSACTKKTATLDMDKVSRVAESAPEKIEAEARKLEKDKQVEAPIIVVTDEDTLSIQGKAVSVVNGTKVTQASVLDADKKNLVAKDDKLFLVKAPELPEVPAIEIKETESKVELKIEANPKNEIIVVAPSAEEAGKDRCLALEGPKAGQWLALGSADCWTSSSEISASLKPVVNEDSITLVVDNKETLAKLDEIPVLSVEARVSPEPVTENKAKAEAPAPLNPPVAVKVEESVTALAEDSIPLVSEDPVEGTDVPLEEQAPLVAVDEVKPEEPAAEAVQEEQLVELAKEDSSPITAIAEVPKPVDMKTENPQTISPAVTVVLAEKSSEIELEKAESFPVLLIDETQDEAAELAFIESAGKDGKERIKYLRDQVKKSHGTYREKKEKYSEARKARKKLREERKELRAKVQKSKEEGQKLCKAKKKDKCDETKKNVAELENKEQKMTQEIADLKAEIRTLKAEAVEEIKELHATRIEIKQLSKKQ